MNYCLRIALAYILGFILVYISARLFKLSNNIWMNILIPLMPVITVVVLNKIKKRKN